MLFEDSNFNLYDEAEHKAMKAGEHYEDGQTEQAIRRLDEAIAINPANSCWHFDKALALDSLNRFNDAICEYETALELSPGDTEILNALAIDYTRVGLYDLAIQTYEQIEQLDPSFEPSYCNRIITYTEMGKHEQAEEMFYMAQQINPNCPLCFYNIGNSFYIQKKFKKAILCWQMAAKLDAGHPQINYHIAQACWADGNLEDAKRFFLEGLRSNPADIECIGDFGLFLLQTGDMESAKEKFNRIIEINPDCAAAYFYLGEIAYNSDDIKKAIASYRQAIEKDGVFVGPRYRLAFCYLLIGETEKARAYLATELQLGTENPEVLVSMGSIFIKLGDLDLAQNCLLKAIDHDITNDRAYYLLGCANIINQKFENAEGLLKKAIDLNPTNKSALMELAHLYITKDKFKDAQELINQLQKINTTDRQLKKLEKLYSAKQTIGQLSNFFSRFNPSKKRFEF